MDLESKLKEELNDKQFEVATHTDGPLVVMAGAGSGKTHVVMNRIAYLVYKGTKAERILVVTFTNAAADEIIGRASNLYDSVCSKIKAGTYHKFCNTMLRIYGQAIGINNYTILSGSDNKNLIDYVKSSDIRFKDLKNFPSSKVLVSIYSKAVNCQTDIKTILTSDQKWMKYLEYVNEIELLQESVRNYCKEVQKYNYDDLLIYMNELLDNDEICEKIANKFDYIMVDEFQDTNNLQEDILLKLSKYNKNIMVVGDISQSIYAFRGANVRNLQNFNKVIPNCKTVVLDTNYRSTQQVLDFANEVMNNNVQSWDYYDMKSADDKKGGLPQWIKPYDEFEQTNNVFDLIREFHSKGVKYSDMAVIERGSMSSFNLESELMKANIPFEKRGGMKFMDYDCVGDMLAYLSIIVKPYDLLSWFRILKIHPFIGNANAKKIADNCTNEGFLVEDKYKSRKYYHELDELDTHYTIFRNEENFHKVIDKIIDFYFDVRQRALNFSKMKDEYKIDAQEAIERDKEVLEQFKNMSTKYETITAFLDDLVLDSISEEKSDEDRLIITTIHSAKGLEWKIVFVIDCVNGSLPAYIDESTYFTEADEEELRCFYVAVTRAKEYLYLFSPKFKMKAGFYDKVKPTHYLTTKYIQNCC